jgi:hypothetical protein
MDTVGAGVLLGMSSFIVPIVRWSEPRAKLVWPRPLLMARKRRGQLF